MSWVRGNAGPVEREIELRLEPDDTTIRGRLLNLEGTPLSGVLVTVKTVWQAKPGGVDAWLQDVADLHAAGLLPLERDGSSYIGGMPSKELHKAYFPVTESLLPGHPQLPPPATTDALGRFEFTGLGADRLVALEISDARLAKHQIGVVTREMPSLEAVMVAPPGGNSNVYYGATFDHIVEPGQSITGVVEDVETGEPLSDVTVMSMSGARTRLSIEGLLTTTTDERGRFRIDGMPVGEGNRLKVEPADSQPYLMNNSVEVPEGNGTEPVDVAVKLRRGVIVRGRVLDEQTGEPVDATLHYHAYLSNEHAKDYGRFNPNVHWADYDGDRYRTNDRGEYQIVVIPGRGILGVRANDMQAYCKGVGGEEIAGRDEEDHYPTYDFCSTRAYNRLAEIDIAEGTTAIERDLPLTRGAATELELVDASGQPLDGACVCGQFPWYGRFEKPLKTNRVEIEALRADEVRQVALWHEERKLGLVVDVEPSETIRRVTLLPCAWASGQLVDSDGDLLADASLVCALLPGGDYGLELARGPLDEPGRLRIENLLPGGSYRLVVHSQKHGWKTLSEKLAVEPGESVDFGTVDVTSEEAPEPARAKLAADDEKITVRGRVLDAAGQPAAGATVRLARIYWDPSIEHKPLNETTTDQAGRFEIAYRKSQFNVDVNRRQQWKEVTVAAFRPGSAPGWAWLDELPPGEPVELHLANDDLAISGRLVDLEGSPLAGVRVEPGELQGPKEGRPGRLAPGGQARRTALDRHETSAPWPAGRRHGPCARSADRCGWAVSATGRRRRADVEPGVRRPDGRAYGSDGRHAADGTDCAVEIKPFDRT